MSATAANNKDYEALMLRAEQLIERRSIEALPMVDEIKKAATTGNDTELSAKAIYIEAFYNCIVTNNYNFSIRLCSDWLKRNSKQPLCDTSYKLYMTLGNAYHLQGDVFEAQNAYLSGLKLLEQKPQLTTREKGFLASFYYNVSLLLSTSELSISTEEYLENAIRIYEELGNNFKLSKSYAAYASVLENKNENHKAINLMFKALELDNTLNDAYSIALSKANLGILHLRIQDTGKAWNYLGDAFDFYRTNEMEYETAMVKVSMGEVLFTYGKQQEGITILLEAEEIFTRLANHRELSNLYKLCAELFEKLEDYKTALHYQRKHLEKSKAIFDEAKTRALARAKSEFESDQKEKEAALLRVKNEEIQHYADKLEQSNNQLNQFAHVASHDLREPLRMVNSYITLLERSMKDSLTPQQKEFMNFATDGAKRMEQLILDLLRLAKVGANPKVEEVDMNSLAMEVKMNLQVLVAEKNASVMFAQLPVLRVDKTMFSQLLQNIVGNGIKYNESLTPSIHVWHRVSATHFTLFISDNGIGIPKEMRDKAFQIFQRLPTAKKYAGSGIGLAVCKKIVESFDGKISIDANQGGGSVFQMEFPLTVLAI